MVSYELLVYMQIILSLDTFITGKKICRLLIGVRSDAIDRNENVKKVILSQ